MAAWGVDAGAIAGSWSLDFLLLMVRRGNERAEAEAAESAEEAKRGRSSREWGEPVLQIGRGA